MARGRWHQGDGAGSNKEEKEEDQKVRKRKDRSEQGKAKLARNMAKNGTPMKTPAKAEAEDHRATKEELRNVP